MTAATTTTVDDAELRAARRDRVFDAMEAAGLDVLVLGRRDSVTYATGARALWTAGTRLFGAAAVLVGGDRRAVHLLSSWDEGVPPEIPFEHLYGVTWNPAVMAEALGSIPGLAEARRLGGDGMSVGFAKAATRLAPGAAVVPADDVLHAARSVKLPAEVELIRAATAVAGAAVDVAAGALAAGATPTGALAAAIEAAAAAGVTVPASAPVVEPVPGPGDLVHVDLGFLVDGYEGGRGRTVPAGGPPAGGAAGAAVEAGTAALGRLAAACRPSATGADLRAAVGAEVTAWTVRGAGMGYEPPVVTAALGADATLAAGMVLSVAVDAGGVRRRDMVHVAPDGPEVL